MKIFPSALQQNKDIENIISEGKVYKITYCKILNISPSNISPWNIGPLYTSPKILPNISPPNISPGLVFGIQCVVRIQ